MGTLTGTAPELSEHCVHKLATSCRLTATPTCCACQDKRPHAEAYQAYIDGVGLVHRARRWQRYCWFCKEFWENRINALQPRIDPRFTRVPDDPDQSEFLARWAEYHRGFRIEKREDGSEVRLDMKPEKAWIDTPPGELPIINEQDRIMARQRELRQAEIEAQSREYVSIDTALDNLLEEVEEEESRPRQGSRPIRQDGHEHNPRPARRTAMQPPSSTETDALLHRLRNATRLVHEAQTRRAQLATDLRQAEQHLRICREDEARLVRDRNGQLHLARVFGSREEIERQGNDYVSPLTDMFTRAYDRYRVAEEVRQEARLYDLSAQQQNLLLSQIRARDMEMWGVRRPDPARASQAPAPTEPEPVRTLDDKAERPPPMTDEEMTLKLDCKVCLQQRADTAVLPCGHLVMCSSCAGIVIPGKREDPMTPASRDAQCPFCRRKAKRLARIYTA